MNPEIKKQWVEALRSGEYKRVVGYLRIGDDSRPKFCCLGVLCDLAEKAGIGRWEPFQTDYYKEDGGRFMFRTNYADDFSPGILPLGVRDWAGLASRGAKVDVQNFETSLALLNDNGFTFEQIADVIEEEL